MKNIKTAICISAAILLAVSGCSPDSARRIEAGGARSLLSVNKINMADWNEAASSLVNDMLASGCLDSFKQKPVKMAVGRIVNRTSRSIETDLLTRQITIALNNSGKVRVAATDAFSKEQEKYEAFMNDKKVSLPKLVMTGKIIEDRESVDGVREVTYVFILSLASGGEVIWEAQKQIAKQAD